MKFKIASVLLLVFILFFSISCNKIEPDLEKLNAFNDSLKKQFAPDSRVAVYDIQIIPIQNKILVKGETNLQNALLLLKQKISDKKTQIIDSTVLLPDASVGEFIFAVVNNSVANIRSDPQHAAELGTQALLGTGLNVLKIVGDFYRIQTPDAYISWVDHGGVTLMKENDYVQWLQSEKIIYTKTFGFVYQNENEKAAIVSDIVLGAQLKFLQENKEFYKVEYPDKRIGYIKKNEAQVYQNWLKNLQGSGELIETYAREFVGFPYLWGGTSSKGMDCSGFTKMVYLMNGYIIPRDASQQIMAGKKVDSDLKFEGLEKGDLLFFGTKATADKKQRVTHVGIWLGNNNGEFIHASKQIRLSSVYPESGSYDVENTSRYLGSRRYLGEKDDLITNLKTDQLLTHMQP